MKILEIMKNAKEELKNNNKKLALITLIYFAFNLVLFLPVIGLIAYIVILPVITFGYKKVIVDLKQGKEIQYLDFVKLGFESFGKVWNVIFKVALKCIIPIMLIVIGGILMRILSLGAFKGNDLGYMLVTIVCLALFAISVIWITILDYKFKYSTLELIYEPQLSSRDIVERCGEFMHGKKIKAFVLDICFWFCLLFAFICFMIPIFWVYPFINIAKIYFYESVSNRN